MFSLCLRLSVFISVVTLSLNLLGQSPWELRISTSGAASIIQESNKVVSISPALANKDWRFSQMAPIFKDLRNQGTRQGIIVSANGTVVDCTVTPTPIKNGVSLSYVLTPQKALELNAFFVGFEMPMNTMAGRSCQVDGKDIAVPKTFADEIHLFTGTASALKFTPAGGRQIKLAVETPTNILVQDNRKWGDSLTFRIGPAMNGETWPARKPLKIKLSITSPEMKVVNDQVTVIAAGKEWIPLVHELDIVPGSALDFSKLSKLDGPAGKHGNLIVRPDGHFAFRNTPDRKERFYGVNLCFTANYLEHAEADRLADRLIRLGYNTVRFHHHERELVDKNHGTTTTFLPKSLDRLDYLFAALKKRGVYVTTDLYVSRPVFAREVWPDAPANKLLEMNEYKMLVLINEQAYKNWQEFTTNFLGHTNPYTKLKYANDPGLAWLSMINEGTPTCFITGLKGRARSEWQAAWNKWLKQKYQTTEALSAAWGGKVQGKLENLSVPLPKSQYDDTPQARDLIPFFSELEINMFNRMKSFLRNDLGCKALLTNQNGWTNRLGTQASRAPYDYADDHFYIDHPRFLGQSWRLPSRCPNTSPIAAGAPGGTDSAFVRLIDRPFTISEYNYSAPGRFRGVGGILTGSLAAIQDWDVIWRFAYAHGRREIVGSSAMNYFNVSSDPLNQAAERASICLYLRGDLKPATHSVAIAMTPNELIKSYRKNRNLAPDWKKFAWVLKVGTALRDKPGKVDADLTIPLAWGSEAGEWAKTNQIAEISPYAPEAPKQLFNKLKSLGWLKGNVTDLSVDKYQSDNGNLLIDAPTNTMVLNTDFTQGVFAPIGESVTTKDAEFSVAEADATVWVSSLDANPIATSKRLLVTHLTDLQNTGATYADSTKTILLNWGKLPHLVRNGSATVKLSLRDAAKAQVYALSTGGKRLGKVAAKLEGERLIIPLAIRDANSQARILYEVVVE